MQSIGSERSAPNEYLPPITSGVPESVSKPAPTRGSPSRTSPPSLVDRARLRAADRLEPAGVDDRPPDEAVRVLVVDDRGVERCAAAVVGIDEVLRQVHLHVRRGAVRIRRHVRVVDVFFVRKSPACGVRAVDVLGDHAVGVLKVPGGIGERDLRRVLEVVVEVPEQPVEVRGVQPSVVGPGVPVERIPCMERWTGTRGMR